MVGDPNDIIPNAYAYARIILVNIHPNPVNANNSDEKKKNQIREQRIMYCCCCR